MVFVVFAIFVAEREPSAVTPQSSEQRVQDLLARMTLEEKFWQLFMIPGDLDNPADDYSKGIFGLQISTGPAAGGSIARAHAERIKRDPALLRGADPGRQSHQSLRRSGARARA